MSDHKDTQGRPEPHSYRQSRRQFLRTTGLVAISATAGSRVAGAEGAYPRISGETSLQPSAHFSPQANWIWDDGNRWGYHQYNQFRREFTLGDSEVHRIVGGASGLLRITADAYYQAWLNGRVIGHGPAKSAEGRRSVDTWEIRGLLSPGPNELLVVVLSMGTGTMNYCPGEAGLIFELDLAGRKIFSDGETAVRPDPGRQMGTARRWIMPCIEDIAAEAEVGSWARCTVVEKPVELYTRRVPLPTREVLSPKRIVATERVRVPNVALTMRVRPYLNEWEQKRRSNMYNTPAYVVTEIVSPIDQTLTFTPTLGNITWYLRGQKLFVGSGWSRWRQTDPPVRIQLLKGRNRLIGVHNRFNHFEDLHLAGFAPQPVEFTNPFGQGGFQVVRVEQAKELVEGPAMQSIDWAALQPNMSEMDPAATMPFGNAYDLVYGSELLERNDPSLTALMETTASELLVIPPGHPGGACRVIVDLGLVHNGWLAFDVEGREGSRLIFAMFEGLEAGPPMRIQWPDGCNNALTYRLRNGHQSFESFFPYGVRYIAIQHTGVHPVALRNLRVLTANCGSQLRGSLLSDDELLNSIYRLCAQSVISGVDDTFTDCPTYEQVNWNCDNRMAPLGDAVTCFNSAVVSNSIELFAEDPRYKGLVRSQYPSTWDLQIPLWSFHWLMACWDYYWRTADKDFVGRIMPRVAAGIEEGLAKIGARGLLEWPGVWHFIEWGAGRDDEHDIMSAEQAGFVGALGAAIQLAGLAGGGLCPACC